MVHMPLSRHAGTSPQLPVSAIINANASWVRQDMGDLAALAQDIKHNGLQQPILLASDYLVFDGARRLLAAQLAGVRHVPVQICQDMDTFTKFFDPMAPGSYPMTWLELQEFWALLKTLMQPVRYATATKTRRGEAVGPPINKSYSGVALWLAERYQEEPSTIKILRDTLTQLDVAEERYPEFVAAMRERMRHASLPARSLVRCRLLKAALRNYVHGMPMGATLSLYDERINQEKVQFKLRSRSMAAERVLDATAPVVPLKNVEKLVEVLQSVGLQASAMTNLALDSDPEEIYVLIRDMNKASDAIYRLRRRLRAVADRNAPIHQNT